MNNSPFLNLIYPTDEKVPSDSSAITPKVFKAFLTLSVVNSSKDSASATPKNSFNPIFNVIVP